MKRWGWVAGQLGLAAAIPAGIWWMTPAGASWEGTDDRMGEYARPAGRALYAGPEWSEGTERGLFLLQAAMGAGLAVACARRAKGERKG